jgi:hypothetical protein
MQTVAQLEILNRDVLDKVASQDARAADKHVERPERRLDLIHRSTALARIGQIRSDPVAASRHLARCTLKTSAIARDQPDVSAKLSETPSDGEPDAPRSPRDDHGP